MNDLEQRARESQSLYTRRTIDHGEAREVAHRLINSHFRQEPHARVGIPARPDYDDDLLILAYIGQQEAKALALTKEVRAEAMGHLEKIRHLDQREYREQWLWHIEQLRGALGREG